MIAGFFLEDKTLNFFVGRDFLLAPITEEFNLKGKKNTPNGSFRVF